jgi:hypothetical protein
VRRLSRLAVTAMLLAAAILLVDPAVAEACSVCGGGDSSEESKMAFIVTTAMLSFLPLGMLGGLAYWIRKRVKAIESGEAQPSL